MLRLILDSIRILDNDNTTEAIVTLKVDDDLFTGQKTLEDDSFIMVAEATLKALRKYLPPEVELTLDKAAKIKHEGIEKDLLVVTVNYRNSANGEQALLTGTCLSNSEEAAQNIAKATLDATNRITSHLMEEG